MIESILSDWSVFGIIAKLVWLVQLGLIIHVFKTGRPYFWFWVLLVAPVIGGIAYVLIELLPNLQSPGNSFTLWKPRAWRIRALRAELEESDTVKLRLCLANELLAGGKAPEACAVAEECLNGAFRDDPHTLARVARFRLEAGKYHDALVALDQVRVEADRMLGNEVAFLRGWAFVQAGRQTEAQPILRTLESVLLGEQPRYFLAVSLEQSGNRTEARAIWEDIRKRFRRAGRGWRRAEQRWFKLAGERLKQTAS
jgi:hypothetical protein